jgi:hypothetical protein
MSALEALGTLERQLRLNANCALAVDALDALGEKSSRSFGGNQVANAIWCLGCCIRQSEEPVSFLEVEGVLNIFIVDPERMNSGVRGKQEAAGSRRERIDQVAHQSSSAGWWRCRQSPVVSLVHWITSRNISEINVSFKRQRKETSFKRQGGKMVPFINQVLHAISRGGNCGDASQPPQPWC